MTSLSGWVLSLGMSNFLISFLTSTNLSLPLPPSPVRNLIPFGSFQVFAPASTSSSDDTRPAWDLRRLVCRDREEDERAVVDSASTSERRRLFFVLEAFLEGGGGEGEVMESSSSWW